MVAFGGGVLLALCPECIQGRIIIERQGGQIRITMPKPSDNRIVLASDIPQAGIVAARPKVEKVVL